jgi:cytochrome c peroxidase
LVIKRSAEIVQYVRMSTHLFASLVCCASLVACEDVAGTTGPEAGTLRSGGYACDNSPYLVAQVRDLLDDHGVEPLERPDPIRPELVELGRALFHDKILSGGNDVSCGTCHNPGLGLGDGRPLFSGVRGLGLGPDREGGQVGGRHSQTLFNLHTLKTLTIDGKVEEVGGNVIGLGLPVILPQYQTPFEDFGGVVAPHVIAGQAMLPEVTFGEMLGIPGQQPHNELLDCVNPVDPLPVIFACVFDGYMARLGQIPEYVEMFEDAYPGLDFADMNFGHAGNAIAAYELQAFASNNSPWDRFLAGDDCALDNTQLRGARLFYGDAGCANCHSGAELTDNEFHQTLAPQFGCGNDLPKRNGATGLDDFGRARNEYAGPWVFGGFGDEIFPVEERYRWRTPPLRNVEFTAPYGRLGQYPTLEAYVRHYRNPVTALQYYNPTKQLPDVPVVDHTGFCSADSLQDTLLDNSADILAAGIDPLLADVDVDGLFDVPRLTAFLEALSDPAADPAVLGASIPDSVPSGLPVDAP